MTVVAIIIEPFTAFSNGKIVVVPPCCPHIEEIGSSFSSTNSCTVNALLLFIVVIVRHYLLI